MPGVGLQGLQEDAESPGQAGHGHRQGEEAAQQGHSRLTFIAKLIKKPTVIFQMDIHIHIRNIQKTSADIFWPSTTHLAF